MRKTFVLALALSLVAFPSHAVTRGAKKEVKKGNSLYNKGKFEEALKRYEEALLNSPDSDIVNFNLGAALYKTKDYKAAASHFEKSLVSSDRKLEQNANYNLGNAEYKYGITKENSDIDGAINLLTKALGHYERAISLDHRDEDAKHNYEFVKKELERLKKKKKERPPQKQRKEEREKKAGQQKAKEKTEEGKEKQSKLKIQKGKEQKRKGEEESKKREGSRSQKPQERSRGAEQKKKQEEQKEMEKKAQPEEGLRKAEGRQPEGKGKPQEAAASQEGKSAGRAYGEMTQQEAASLLENYRNEEEPRGLYREKRPPQWEGAGYKDW